MERFEATKNPSKIQEELEKMRSQFYIFYELTQAMRTTLRLDEIAYIILTGITAHQGLGFNRAVLFLKDDRQRRIRGFMGVGPVDGAEAQKIWTLIEEQKMDLYSLIKTYRKIKEGDIEPKLMKVVRSLVFPMDTNAGLIFEALHEVSPIRISSAQVLKKYPNDPLVKALNLKDFVIAPLLSKNEPLGVLVIDNPVTRKEITDEDIRILTMFANQSAGAIENSQTYEDTLFKAHTDPLTSLWNYGFFQYRLDEEIMRSHSEKTSLSVIMLDIDDFKKFNDSFGHQKGDEALMIISGQLKKYARKIDIVCRYGGEEFALIIPNSRKEESLAIAQRIRTAIEQTNIDGKKLTVSIGVSAYPHDSQEKKELIKKADLALYRAKAEGKNKVILA